MRIRSGRLALFLVAFASQPATAQTTNWDGTTGVWSDSLRWDNGVPNSNTAIAQFLTGGTPFVSTIDGTFTVNQLNVNNANARVFADSGSTLSLGGTTPTATLTNGFFQIDGGTVSGGSWQLVDGEFTANGGLVQNTSFTTTGNGRVKIGNGFTTFSNVNLGSGVVEFGSSAPARMRITNGTTLAPMVMTFDGNAGNSPNTGVFAVDQTMSLNDFTLNLDGDARFEVENAHTATIMGYNSRIQINAGAVKDGVIRISDPTGMFINGYGGNIRSEVSGRTLTIDGSNFTNDGTVIASNGGQVVVATSNATSGGYGVFQASSGGVIQISDTTNFTDYDAGTFTLSAGSFDVGQGATINVGAREIRNLATYVRKTAGSFVGFDGVLSNILPSGEFDLRVADYNVSNASSSFTNSGSIVVSGGAKLTIDDSINLSNFSEGSLNGGSWHFFQAGYIDLGTRIVTTIGTGTTLIIGHSETPHPAFNALEVNNGHFELYGVPFSTAGNFVNNGELLLQNGAPFTVAASSTFTNNGLLDLSDSATFTLNSGATLINNGVMNVTTGATINTSTPSFVQSGTVTIAAASTWGGAGTVTVQNTGVLRVDGSVNKNVVIDAGGRLQGRGTITGDVDLSGELAPGDSAGTIKIDGSIVQTGSSTTTIEIGGVNPGTQYDQIVITQSIMLDGQLKLSMIDGFAPTFQDEFMILQAGSILGRWSNTPDDVYIGENFRMHVNYASTFVSLSGFTAVPEPGTLALVGLGSLGILFARRVRTLAGASS